MPERQSIFAWMSVWDKNETLRYLWYVLSSQEELDIKDDLQHNENCAGLLALKILKGIKEYVKAEGKLHA